MVVVVVDFAVVVVDSVVVVGTVLPSCVEVGDDATV